MPDGERRIFPDYMEGNYGVGWGDIDLPEGRDGQMIVARNFDGGGNTRIYAFADGTWGKVNLTGD